MIPNFFVVEYSKTQDAFHVQEVTDMLKTNVGSIRTPHVSDYLVVGIFEKEKEAREFADKFREALNSKKDNWVDNMLSRIV